MTQCLSSIIIYSTRVGIRVIMYLIWSVKFGTEWFRNWKNQAQTHIYNKILNVKTKIEGFLLKQAKTKGSFKKNNCTTLIETL